MTDINLFYFDCFQQNLSLRPMNMYSPLHEYILYQITKLNR